MSTTQLHVLYPLHSGESFPDVSIQLIEDGKWSPDHNYSRTSEQNTGKSIHTTISLAW